MSKKKNNKDGARKFLELDKEHKDWYDVETGMGKQRGKPHAVPAKVKKEKGSFKKHDH